MALILIPPLISADSRHRVTPIDRLTLPLLSAALLSAVLVTFDGSATYGRYRSAETCSRGCVHCWRCTPTPRA